ncbi:uncharacterized protein [Asterias amurensis]|uniref:uncharacterized protein n=1 Tax=Asterias amurensis TaxID=7602 RepID=UPI003AB23076
MEQETPIEDDVKKKVMLRPPNRRRFDDQLEQVALDIRTREAELKSLGRPQTQTDTSSEQLDLREALLKEQKECREQKEVNIAKRKALDEQLKLINESITKQSDSLSKLEAGLAYKTEAAVDDAIQKLQYQLRTRHFKLSEENRIVKEIDTYRRSKKKVKEYLQQKEQIKIQRDRKKCLKDERDKYFRQVSLSKSKEDEVKQKLMTFKSKTDEAWSRYREAGPERETLKKEIGELHERRRQLTVEFRLQNSKYHMQQKQQRAHSFKRKEEEKRAIEEARQREWAVYEASREPYEDERQLCSTLIKYLHRYLTPDHELPLGASALSPGQSPASSVSTPTGCRDDMMTSDGVEFVILKKKINDSEDVFLPTTSAKKKRAIRKHNRKSSWLSKPIRHTAPIFSQFDTLGLQAPSTIGEVPSSISQLTVKKNEYDEMVKINSSIPSDIPSGESSYSLSNQTHQETHTTSSALDQIISSVTELSVSQSDKKLNHIVTKSTNALPRIDIESAQAHSIQRQTNSTPGNESAPETPNSSCSIAKSNDGDQDLKDVESIDSGIGINRLKSTSSVPTSASPNTDIKCREENTTSDGTHETSLVPLTSTGRDAFIQLDSVPLDRGGQFGNDAEMSNADLIESQESL